MFYLFHISALEFLPIIVFDVQDRTVLEEHFSILERHRLHSKVATHVSRSRNGCSSSFRGYGFNIVICAPINQETPRDAPRSSVQGSRGGLQNLQYMHGAVYQRYQYRKAGFTDLRAYIRIFLHRILGFFLAGKPANMSNVSRKSDFRILHIALGALRNHHATRAIHFLITNSAPCWHTNIRTV